jgi:nicotinate dehydrogenase subunit B
MDELAAAAHTDPIAFRSQYVSSAHVRFLEALARRAGWQTRPSPSPTANTTGVITRGRGMAVSISTGPGGMTNDFGEVVEVEVNRKTGQVRVTRVTAAITAGLIINPDSVIQQVEGNTILGISQALKEERMFDEQKVTSVDWVTYPILRFTDAPDEIDVLLFNSPHELPGIASELNGIPAPAIGNAIFDATGVRIRTLPFTPERVHAALKKAGKAM